MSNGKRQKISIAVSCVVILSTILYLAVSGAGSSKSYFVTVAEMQGMGEKAYHSNLRVDGYVKPESIERNGANVSFVLTEFESHNPKATPNPHAVRVIYRGSEPPPDTFKGDAQALAIGTWGRDGVFHATQLQAKCASKYAPAQQNSGKPGTGAPSPAPPTQPAAGDKRATAAPATNGASGASSQLADNSQASR